MASVLLVLNSLSMSLYSSPPQRLFFDSLRLYQIDPPRSPFPFREEVSRSERNDFDLALFLLVKNQTLRRAVVYFSFDPILKFGG